MREEDIRATDSSGHPTVPNGHIRVTEIRVRDIRVKDIRVKDIRVKDIRVKVIRVKDIRVKDMRATDSGGRGPAALRAGGPVPAARSRGDGRMRP